MPEPIATWNPATSTWDARDQCLCGRSVAYSETLPNSGMTRGGRLFARPTSEPPTDASECSCWHGLPTPTTRDHKDHMIRREPHRPDSVDTLSRALADLI